MRKRKTHQPRRQQASSDPARSYQKKITAILLITLACALGLRIAALLSLSKTPYFQVALLDETIYHTWASQIADGSYKPSAAYQFSPLPAYVLGFVYEVLSPDIIYFRILNIVLGVGTCYFVYLIACELGNRKTGLYACVIAASRVTLVTPQ